MENEQTASHSEDVQEQHNGLSDEQYNEVMRELGYEPQAPQNESDETIGSNEDDSDEEGNPPAIEEQPKNVRTVKFNKQEVQIEEDKIDELLQKGLALEKERERKSEYEKALQRAAKLAGFDSHEEYLKSLDQLEQQAKQREQEQFKELKQQLREEAENAGLDPDKLDQYLDNHPLMKQAKEAIAEREKMEQASRAAQERSAIEKQWEELFSRYPDLANLDDAEWLNADMKRRLDSGYHPLDAYELAHKDKIMESERKKLEQSLIKQQRLNKRAAVEGNVPAEPDDDVPDTVKGAFQMFGLDPRTAKKFITKR